MDLVARLLEYTPSLRMTPLAACAHSFFDELREQGTRLPNGRELPPLFNFTEHELRIQPNYNAALLPKYIQEASSAAMGAGAVAAAAAGQQQPAGAGAGAAGAGTGGQASGAGAAGESGNAAAGAAGPSPGNSGDAAAQAAQAQNADASQSNMA